MPDIKSDPNRMLTVKEAAEFLGLSERAVYDWIAEGKLPAWKPHARVTRVPYDRLVELTHGSETVSKSVTKTSLRVLRDDAAVRRH